MTFSRGMGRNDPWDCDIRSKTGKSVGPKWRWSPISTITWWITLGWVPRVARPYGIIGTSIRGSNYPTTRWPEWNCRWSVKLSWKNNSNRVVKTTFRVVSDFRVVFSTLDWKTTLIWRKATLNRHGGLTNLVKNINIQDQSLMGETNV